MSQPRRSLKRALLALSGLAAALIGVELALIVLEPWLLQGFYVYDRQLGFRVRPHHQGSNEFGFNDRDYPARKPADTYRVLVLGDSFNWEGGPDLNYVGIARSSIHSAFPDRRIDVINAGYPMTHTGEQLQVLERFGLRYDPDLVVLAFFAGNDFLDGDPNRKRVVLNQTFLDVDRREEKHFLGYPIVPASRLLELIKQTLTVARAGVSVGSAAGDPVAAAPVDAAMRKPAPGAPRPGEVAQFLDLLLAVTETGIPPPAQAAIDGLAEQCPPETGGPRFSRDAFLDIVESRLTMASLAPRHLARLAPRVEYILGRVDAMAELLSERGIGFRVAILPAQYQIDRDLLDAVLARTGRHAGDYDLDRAQALLRAHLDQRGIPYLDLLDIVRHAHRRRPAYIENDTHWNRFGNLVVGHVLALYLNAPIARHFGDR